MQKHYMLVRKMARMHDDPLSPCWSNKRCTPGPLTDEQTECWIGCKTCTREWTCPMTTNEHELVRQGIDERRKHDTATHEHDSKEEQFANAEEAIMKAQNKAKSMVITIADPDEEKHGKRRTIKIQRNQISQKRNYQKARIRRAMARSDMCFKETLELHNPRRRIGSIH